LTVPPLATSSILLPFYSTFTDIDPDSKTAVPAVVVNLRVVIVPLRVFEPLASPPHAAALSDLNKFPENPQVFPSCFIRVEMPFISAAVGVARLPIINPSLRIVDAIDADP
jgi:hypothetical protein